ncbi:hypothetical protein N657DRAFT_26261 [Parathielavia appendiculata]|uniref:Uncharacterized protein n=1 Tax=Parathielavia appendiculata TaxID=2587402 RepID=A0AAN6Z846_9PEZI|nr:hypothetical protein N657DRAFT_26261 [Parathielavia appendiculata]
MIGMQVGGLWSDLGKRFCALAASEFVFWLWFIYLFVEWAHQTALRGGWAERLVPRLWYRGY